MSQSTKQVLNLSCEHINQLFSAKGKTAPAVPLPLEAKRQNGQIALHIYNLITVIQDFGFNRIFNLKWSLFGLDFEIKLLDQIWI